MVMAEKIVFKIRACLLYTSSIAIQGTQKLHGFIPIPSSISKVKVKVFSESDISTTEKVTTIQDRLQLTEISGYITNIYENNWWLAYVLMY